MVLNMESVECHSTSCEGRSPEVIPMDVGQERNEAVATAVTGRARSKTASATGQASSDLVYLIPKDGKPLSIPKDAAMCSPTIEERLQNGEVSLNVDISERVLKKVVEYLKLKQEHKTENSYEIEFAEDYDMAIEMLAAACFFNC